MGYWLKVAGSGDQPFIHDDPRPRDEAWRKKLGDVTAFPSWRRPSGIKKGDVLIVYAAGSPKHFGEGRIYAVDEVVSEEPELSGHERWGWMLHVRRRAIVPLLSRAPTLSDIDVDPKSVRQQSHIRLAEHQGRLAERLIQAQSDSGHA